MNARIIELLQQPSLIQNTDLQLLEKQIEHTPYIQNVRALYLYGIHLYMPERYKDVLTTTAAYTTDKKILYQFINKKSLEESQAISAPILEDEKEKASEIMKPISEDKIEEVKASDPAETQDEGTLLTEIIKTDKPIEENLEQHIKRDSTKEDSSDVVVNNDEKETLSQKEKDVFNDNQKEFIDNSNPSSIQTSTEETEIIVEETSKEDIITEELTVPEIKEEVNKDVSFEAIDDFLPEVKFSVPKNHHQFLNPPKFEVMEHKDVDIAFGKKTQKQNLPVLDEVEETSEKNLDFGPFNEEVDVSALEGSKIENAEKTVVETSVQEDNTVPEIIEKIENSTWKPMSIDTHQPDALIGKVASDPVSQQVLDKTETIQTEEVAHLQENQAAEILETDHSNLEESTEIMEDKRPIFNVSFFGESVSIVKDEDSGVKEVLQDKEEITPEQILVSEDNIEENVLENKTEKSNVSQFINTWQSWLKIDRSEEIEKDKEIKKQKAIDQFIENQPKISQLKDEPNFIIKEKKEDISHLMTETLANLYLEQKLYSKAIKAFEILKLKYPEKTDYFEAKIKDIKEQRKA